MGSEQLLDTIYFTGPFGAMGRTLHFIILVCILIGLYPVPEA